jgi:putative transposase
MLLNDAGEIVWDVWNSLTNRFPQISTGTAVVMPNHFHGVLTIHEFVRAVHEPLLPDIQPRQMTIPLIMGYFKMNSAKRINEILNSKGSPVWQRNYFDHIIRDEDEFNRIHLYIQANPENWSKDDENPQNKMG